MFKDILISLTVVIVLVGVLLFFNNVKKNTSIEKSTEIKALKDSRNYETYKDYTDDELNDELCRMFPALAATSENCRKLPKTPSRQDDTWFESPDESMGSGRLESEKGVP